MSGAYREVNFKEISEQDILDVCYDEAHNLVLLRPDTELIKSSKSSRKLTWQEKANLRYAFYWLNMYEPNSDGSYQQIIHGYTEAFYHLCQIKAWKEARKIIFLPLDIPGTAILHEQLGVWGLYHKQIEIYSHLLGKFDHKFNCFCLYGLGNSYSNLGYHKKSLDYFDKHMKTAIAIKDVEEEIKALGGLGESYASLGQYEIAIGYHQRQLKLSQELGDRQAEGWAITYLGWASYNGPHFWKKSKKYFQLALKILENIDDIKLKNKVLSGLSATYFTLGDLNKSIEFAQQYLELSYELNNQREIHVALSRIGGIYVFWGNYDSAMNYLEKALFIAQETFDLSSEAITLNNMGSVFAYRLNQYQSAINFFEKSLKISQDIENKKLQSVVASNLSYCYGCLHEYQKALTYTNIAKANAFEIDNIEAKAIALATLGNAYWYQGSYWKGLVLVLHSLLVLPPWNSINGRIIFALLVDKIIRYARAYFKIRF